MSKKVQSLAKQSEELFSLVCYCAELTFYIELPENCIYLNQSELSNFFIYLMNIEIVWQLLNWIKSFWLTPS